MKNSEALTLFFCGDVMTGRGIDQILPHPGDPTLHEGYLQSAADYVELAENQNGPLSRPLDFSALWGDALEILNIVHPQIRLINLETSITTSDDWEDKGINYRMHPANVPVLTAAGIDVCVLANNHVLDWGQQGLLQTLQTLKQAGIRTVGAGADSDEAQTPAIIPLSPQGRVLIFASAHSSSGVPGTWQAQKGRPGVCFLPDLSKHTLADLVARIRRQKRPGDLLIVSLHWGENWGYEIPEEQIEFARGLIDGADVDLIHGHSSHHAKGLELYHEKLIIYGCGDFINDYEGIRGHEKLRGDLSLMYFPTLDRKTGNLTSLRLVPLCLRRMQLHKASRTERAWLREVLNRESQRGGLSFVWDEAGYFRAVSSEKINSR